MPRNKRLAWTIGAAVTFAVIAGTTLAVLHLTKDSLAPGFVASGTSGEAMSQDVAVHIPIGIVTLSSGRPLDEIAARRVGQGDDGTIAAQGGSVIVPVSWSFRPSLSYDEALGYPMEFSLALTAGGSRYDLGEPDVDLHEAADSGILPEASLLVVVTGDGGDLQFEVTYEDQTQIADMSTGDVDAGLAQPLYAGAGSETYSTDEDCVLQTTERSRYLSSGSSSLSCRIGPLTQSPYLPDLGWAKEGQVWNVVDVSVRAPRQLTWLLTEEKYRVDRGPVTVTLDGVQPVRVDQRDPRSTTQGGAYVFESEPGRSSVAVHVSAPMTAVRPPRAEGGPANVSLGVDQTFEMKR